MQTRLADSGNRNNKGSDTIQGISMSIFFVLDFEYFVTLIKSLGIDENDTSRYTRKQEAWLPENLV